MSNLTIKNLPDDTHSYLKLRAEANGRSLNKEIIVTLENSLRAVRADSGLVRSRARAVREGMDVYLTPKDLADLKNSGRR